MIIIALNSTKSKRMKYTDLCDYIKNRFPRTIEKSPKTYKNSISHTLCSHSIFTNFRILNQDYEDNHATHVTYWGFKDKSYCVCEIKNIKHLVKKFIQKNNELSSHLPSISSFFSFPAPYNSS